LTIAVDLYDHVGGHFDRNAAHNDLYRRDDCSNDLNLPLLKQMHQTLIKNFPI
jgi:hypothetical protein